MPIINITINKQNNIIYRCNYKDQEAIVTNDRERLYPRREE